VGHDLNRGRSTFTKVRPASGDTAAQPVEPIEEVAAEAPAA